VKISTTSQGRNRAETLKSRDQANLETHGLVIQTKHFGSASKPEFCCLDFDLKATISVRAGLRAKYWSRSRRRLRWLGHVIRMEDCRIPNQALNWNLSNVNRKPGRPRKNCQDIVFFDTLCVFLFPFFF